MANRLMFRNYMTLEKAPVALFAKVAIGASGAPTLDVPNSIGIKTVTRSAAGKYVVTLGGPAGVDTYFGGVLSANFICVVSTTSAVTSMNIVTDATPTTGILTIQLVSAQGTAADPASGETLLLRIVLSNTSVAV